VNNSPVAISIADIKLKVKKELLRPIDNRNSYWECVEFYYTASNGEFTTDGSAIYYQNEGISLPCKIEPYDTLTVVSLFHHFPKSISKKAKATLIFFTAIGKFKKKLTLIEYNEDYSNADYLDYLQYCRSIEEGDK
jgi:hypothetical protein